MYTLATHFLNKEALTCTGMMWLGAYTTGSPALTSLFLKVRTTLWCLLRNWRPSSLARIPMDVMAELTVTGGKEVVKMKPEP